MPCGKMSWLSTFQNVMDWLEYLLYKSEISELIQKVLFKQFSAVRTVQLNIIPRLKDVFNTPM